MTRLSGYLAFAVLIAVLGIADASPSPPAAHKPPPHQKPAPKPAPPATSKDPANPVFTDILSRVIQRDPVTGAILRVHARKDGSVPHAMLTIDIKPAPKAPDYVIVTLPALNINPQAFPEEQYRLKLDPVIKAEMAKITKYAALESSTRQKDADAH